MAAVNPELRDAVDIVKHALDSYPTLTAWLPGPAGRVINVLIATSKGERLYRVSVNGPMPGTESAK
jgi:hypothetical protein